MTTRGRRRTIVAVTIAAATLIGAVAGILAARSGEDPASGAPERRPRTEAGNSIAPADDSQPAVPRGVALEPLLTGKPGAGTARLSGRGRQERLELSVSGLPPLEEQYTVWLYNSVSDARRVAGVLGGSFRVSKRLPADPRGYELIDVSREPLDGNPNHSGESVLRASMDSLLRAAR